MKIETRSSIPDILKGVAVILMVQVHIMEQFAKQGLFDSKIGVLSLFLGGPPVAPVFMTVLGYFAVTSSMSFLQLIQRGIKLILLGFSLNIALNIHLFIHIYQGQFSGNPLNYIFGVDILFLSGISVIVIASLKKIFLNNFLLYFILAILLLIVSPEINYLLRTESMFKFPAAYFGGSYSWSYFPVFPWMAYTLVGASFAMFSKKYLITPLSDLAKFLIVVVTGIFLVISFDFAKEISHNLPEYYHHSIKFFLWVFIFLIFWITVFSFSFICDSKTTLVKGLKWIGKNVTVFYFIQWVLIGNIASAIYKTQNLLSSILWFIVLIIVTSVIVYLWINLIQFTREKRIR